MTTFLRPLLAALMLSACVLPGAALAEAPMVRTQAPGFHRTMLGDFEITALNDGTVRLPVLQLLKGDREQLLAALKRGYLGETVETSVNAFLVNTGSKLVLIDTGAARLFGPTLGNLLANIRAAGYQPEQIDEVCITHMHPDHVGGLMTEGRIAFPKANLRIDRRDTEFWLSQANMAAAPEANKGFFQGAMMSVNPYAEAGRLKPFDGATEIVPGVKAQPAYGHTPGHTIYMVESKGEKLVLWGDLMHVAAVQFETPSVVIAFDSNSDAARAQREAAYADAARAGYLVGVSHVAFPGLGRLQTGPGGKGYTWVPLNYSGMK